MQMETDVAKRTLIELLQKRSPWFNLWLQKNTQDMVWLLPQIQRLLVLLPALQDQHVDCASVANVAISLKPLTNGMPEGGCRDIQSIQVDDFRCLNT